MLAMRRIVYDNDFPAKDLSGAAWERWLPTDDSGWKADKSHGFAYQATAKDDVDWLRYRHILRPVEESRDRPPVGGTKPELITDFMAYNSFKTDSGVDVTPSPNWVGDLMLECNVQVAKADGEFWIELSKGINRFQARWDLSSGVCTLFQLGMDNKKVELDSKPTRLKGSGSYQVRFSNIDARLTVWVDRDLPFDNGREYPPPEVRGPGDDKLSDEALRARRGPTKNDLEPASIGSKGTTVEVRSLRLCAIHITRKAPTGHQTLRRRPHPGSTIQKAGWLTWRFSPIPSNGTFSKRCPIKRCTCNPVTIYVWATTVSKALIAERGAWCPSVCCWVVPCSSIFLSIAPARFAKGA